MKLTRVRVDIIEWMLKDIGMAEVAAKREGYTLYKGK
jgi:hypothetical protein